MELLIEILIAVAVLVMGWQVVKALAALRRQIEAMNRAVAGIGSALEQQHGETRRTLEAIAASVDHTASALTRIEGAMPTPPLQRRF
jgi:uncharacterized protein YoxC